MRKLLFFATIALALSGCVKDGAQSNYGERFSMQLHGQNFNNAIFVITDKQTGQEYIFVKSGHGCGLSPMPTANPKVTQK